MLYVCCWKEMKHAQKQVPYAGPLCFEPSWPSALITDITACTSVHIQEVWRGHRLNGSKFQRVLTFVWAHPNILCLSLGQLHAQCSFDFHNYNSIWDGTTRLIVIHHWGFLIDGGSKLSLSPLLCKTSLLKCQFEIMRDRLMTESLCMFIQLPSVWDRCMWGSVACSTLLLGGFNVVVCATSLIDSRSALCSLPTWRTLPPHHWFPLLLHD